MANAIAVLDAVARAPRRARRRDAPRGRPHLVLPERGHPLRRGDLQDARDGRALGRDRRASATASPTSALRRFRYGVQVNSLGLTEAQPENNVIRIVLEALGVTLSQERALPRAPAAGLERGARPAAAVGPAVVAAHPADPRLRDRPARVRRPLRRLARDRGEDARSSSASARDRARARAQAMGGAVAAVENAYMKQRLVESHTRRLRGDRERRAAPWSA